MTEDMNLERLDEREEVAAHAARNKKVMRKLVTLLSGSSRSKRQYAAATVAIIARENPDTLLEYMDEIADALNRPEAQTRWECLNALCGLVLAGGEPGEDMLGAAEDALYDEDSGIVREAAFRFCCIYGSSNTKASDRVWPLIDEAIQCYHGNPEFNDMLTSLAEFAEGKISLDTSRALADRMRFDSANAGGTLRMRSEQIVDANKRRERKFGRKK